EAEKLRRELDRLSATIDLVESERDKAGRPLAILATLTRILPDDTYLTEVTLQQRKVTLSGRSAAAARLIGALSADEGLRHVPFAELWSDDTGAFVKLPVATRSEPDAPSRVQGPRADELLATVLGRPLFSPTRQPVARANSDQPSGPGLTEVRLTGIVIEPGRHLAIFAMPGSKAMIRGEGETVNDWRVDSISLGEVVLSGPAGSATLQPKIDASLGRPGGAPPRPAQTPPRGAIPAPQSTAAM